MSKDRPLASRLKDLSEEDRPQERLERLGAPALADRELGYDYPFGYCEKDVLALADEMLSKAGSLSGLLRWDTSDFQQIIGIGKIKALQLSTQIEIAKRMIRGERNQISFWMSPKKPGNTYASPI